MSTAPRNTEGFEGAKELFCGALKSGSVSDAITTQEAAGQRSFLNSDTLPKNMSQRDRLALEAAGVKFGDPVPGDDLFVYVELPVGWKRQATNHSMHSTLCDNIGRTRARAFYKAAAYDRSAHLRATTRFWINTSYDAPSSTMAWSIYDGAKQVFTYSESYSGEAFGEDYWKVKDNVKSVCYGWFIENGFPDWEDPSKYWD